MGGFYGLDLNTLPVIWTHLKVPKNQRDEVFEALLLMESAALEVIHKKKD